MKWIWDGAFRAHRLLPSGSREEKVFTSVAQARQFVEQHENVKLANKVRAVHPGKVRRTKGGHSRVPSTFTADQQKLIEAAKQQVRGL